MPLVLAATKKKGGGGGWEIKSLDQAKSNWHQNFLFDALHPR